MTSSAPDGSPLLLSPAAARPPFRWQVALPAGWPVLDTHPASWERSLDRFIDDRFTGQRLRSAERRAIRDYLADLVAGCQRMGTLITLVEVGRLDGGDVASAGLYLAWHDSSPERASLAEIRAAIDRHGTVEEFEGTLGTGLLHTARFSQAPPGSTMRLGLTSLQAFVPIAGQTWTAVVATAAAHPQLVPALRDLVVAVAHSIRILDRDGTAAEGSLRQPGEPPQEPTLAHPPVLGRDSGVLTVHRVEG